MKRDKFGWLIDGEDDTYSGKCTPHRQHKVRSYLVLDSVVLHYTGAHHIIHTITTIYSICYMYYRNKKYYIKKYTQIRIVGIRI